MSARSYLLEEGCRTYTILVFSVSFIAKVLNSMFVVKKDMHSQSVGAQVDSQFFKR